MNFILRGYNGSYRVHRVVRFKNYFLSPDGQSKIIFQNIEAVEPR